MISYIKELIRNKHYKKLVFISVIVLALIVGVVLSTLAIGEFLIEKFDTIMLGGSILVIAIYFINQFSKNRSEERRQREQLALDRRLQAEKQQHESREMAAEMSYNVVRECLYLVLRDVADSLKLVKPTSISSIDSPYHIIDKGNYILLRYICQKSGVCDVDTAKRVINERFRQKLSEGEFPAVQEKMVLFEGRYYPIFIVDSVTDIDNYVNIDIAICTEDYCLHLRNKELSSTKPFDFNDRDF